MTPAAVIGGCAWATPNLVDRVQIYLRKSNYPYDIVATSIGNLYIDGKTNLIPISNLKLETGAYYIVVKNTRNALETWSAQPVLFTIGATTVYDFTKDPASAYGSNMKKVGGVNANYPLGIWAFFSGDVTGTNGCIDEADKAVMEYGVSHFLFGCVRSDLNGDGNVDLLDMAIFEPNFNAMVCVKRP
jgi:hypothetical protein